MPDQTLHDIAKETRHAVAGLEALVSLQAQRLKAQQHKSRRRLIFVVALYVPLAMVVSGFVTVGVIAGCFLDATPPAACQIVPGYSESQERNKKLVEEFRRLQQITIRNDKRLTRLENGG